MVRAMTKNLPLSDPDTCAAFLASVANGIQPIKAAALLGISPRQLRRWKEKDEDFVEDLEDAQRLGFAAVHSVLLAVALEPEHPQWIQAVKELGKHMLPVPKPPPPPEPPPPAPIQVNHQHNLTLESVDTVAALEEHITRRIESVHAEIVGTESE